jgi:peptide deformylase
MSEILTHKQITKKSEPVTDIENQVIPYIQQMAELCRTEKNGRKGIALAHCQFDKDNPLTFYVFANGDTVVNPEILSVKEKTLMWHSEGCLSFPHEQEVEVQRYRIIKARYTLVTNVCKNFQGVRVVEKKLQDMTAYIMQHEMDHFNLKYIYDKEIKNDN